MSESRNEWKKGPQAQAARKKKRGRLNATEEKKDLTGIDAIPKVGTLRQWDKGMDSGVRVNKRVSKVNLRTNPDPLPPPPKPKEN